MGDPNARRRARKRASAPKAVCPKCERELDPVKIHDCGEQGALF